ncbi:MAG: hypothetical protein JJE46_08260 [Acidimicrobiia bacterium]|nr:hypothetical protein [Acidimicrobiia bacterium]
MDLTDLTERLRTIETDLRDRAYEALQAAANGDEEAIAVEKQMLKARRAIERAIRALDPDGGFSEGP